MRWTLTLAMAPLLLTCQTNVWGWDQHHLLTTQLLRSFEQKDPSVWTKLQELVEVRPLEEFLERAFGVGCTPAKAADAVFDGLGRSYRVYFADGMSYENEVDWSHAITRQLNHPRLDAGSRQALGAFARAADILSVYSDEPDWGMDDDVARLRGKGVSQAGEGISTRMLRHFWYQGEVEAGVDFGKDQETDQRAELFDRLSLVAFAVGEPYWGYRFLANALHYVQDVTQPFHTRAIPTGRMVDVLQIIRAKLCEWRRSPECGPDLTVDAQVVRNGWVIAAYHTSLEDFARGLLSPTLPYSSNDPLQDRTGWWEKTEGVEPLPWDAGPDDNPLPALRAVIPAEQRAINVLTQAVGDATYETFGPRLRYELAATQQVIRLTSQDSSQGYRLALLDSESSQGLTARQAKALPALVRLIHRLFVRAGVWSRALVARTLSASTDARGRAPVEAFRARLERRCAI